ncbi:MAG: aspartate-semialdehyde dehydrogenase [Bdellovibrionales bacterium]
MKSLRLGIVGATGLVGREFLGLLEERKTAIEELRLFASERSAGSVINFRNTDLIVKGLEEGCFTGLDVVFFSAGGSVSKVWAPRAAQEGAFAIDNSSAFRMDPEVPLIVPEVNSHCLPKANQASIIANPNCSTIQMVVALKPLQKSFGLKRVIVSTYQSVSGAGSAAVEETKAQTLAYLNNSEPEPKVFPKTIAFNNLPMIGDLEPNGFTTEEMKMINETKKILEDDKLKVSAMCVRTPSLNGHSESVWAELGTNTSKSEFMRSLQMAPGIDLSLEEFPTTREATGKNSVFVGRIHQDQDNPDTWMFWCVADNIRKGAALNGLQIAEAIFDLSPK